jgi:hypothetical protein
LNLLTEDNLPYYHALLEKYMPPTSAFSSWNHLWTAEEAQHAIAIRSYLLTSRNCDPYELEDDRKSTMINGYNPNSGAHRCSLHRWSWRQGQPYQCREDPDDPQHSSSYETSLPTRAITIFYRRYGPCSTGTGLVLPGILEVFENWMPGGHAHSDEGRSTWPAGVYLQSP